jgi:hypothetical protein
VSETGKFVSNALELLKAWPYEAAGLLTFQLYDPVFLVTIIIGQFTAVGLIPS